MARRDWVGRNARWASLGSDWHRRGQLFSGRRGGSLLFGLLGLVSVEPSFEQGDGGAEVVVECEQQVDVVEVFLAGEAVGEVVAWVDGGAHFAAAWAEEAEVAFALFGGWALAAAGADGDGPGQCVPNPA